MPATFTSNDPLVCEFLVLARTNYVYLAELPYYARRLGALGLADERHRTLKALKVLLEAGVWDAGELSPDGFQRWECRVDTALSRIENEWRSLSRPLQPGDICWFSNTLEGDNAARKLLEAGYVSIVKDC